MPEYELVEDASWWQRFLFRIMFPPESARCPWLAPLSQDRCLRKVGHRGRCDTALLINGRRVTKQWYGINYKITSLDGGSPR